MNINVSFQLFELFNFLAENFIFIYIGITLFTFPSQQWDIRFIILSIVKLPFIDVFVFTSFLILQMAIALARTLCIVLLSFILNLARKNPISWQWQMMLIFSGLRGAFAFALAIRNVSTHARSLMYTTTSVIVIITVIFNGTLVAPVMKLLKIRQGSRSRVCFEVYLSFRTNVREEAEPTPSVHRYRMMENSNSNVSRLLFFFILRRIIREKEVTSFSNNIFSEIVAYQTRLRC